MKNNIFRIAHEFPLENGGSLPFLDLSYTTFGEYLPEKSKVVWVFHALTANGNPLEWWPGLFGENDYFNPHDYFIICANVPGSCYGSTGPASLELPAEYRFGNFPLLTIRDIIRAFRQLQNHLGIEHIHLAIGGSFGGYQAIEFSYDNPQVENLILIATAAIETPWNIAIHETQRQAIRADGDFSPNTDAAYKGLEAARGIGMLAYRSPLSFIQSQPRTENQVKDFRSAGYIRYQGEKLRKRFSPWCYYKLTEILDTHDLGRKRGGLTAALQNIHAKTLSIGIESDLLAPAKGMRELADLIPGAAYRSMDSFFGHDGFLIETKQITALIKEFHKTH
jgi:homoserine O-acetyltransferase/O-succinyltransferase